jgi:NAD(P)-dependent dehydrogenase (short-subunit alcohol dehydrogenase family)
MTDLNGRVAMVTGGGSGLGRAISRCFGESGAHVLVADVDGDGAKRTVDLVEQSGGTAEPTVVDVTDPAAVRAAIGDAFSTHGGAFDCLVNNAGTDRGADLVDVDDTQWHQVFGVNVHGPMYTSRAFVRGRLRLQGDEGPAGSSGLADVVNIVSISALTVGAGAGAYNSSKAALAKLTEVLQTEVREYGWPVRVCAIHPAAMDTPMMDQWGLSPERKMDPRVVAELIRHAVTLPPEVVLQSAVPTLRNEYYPR